MGRAKIESRAENTIGITVTSCSVKFNFDIPDTVALGEFIKMERKENNITLHFTKKMLPTVALVEKPIIVTFD
jgi:hypothetical protein